MSYIPSLQANYTVVPNTFLQLALAGKLGREALVVLLYLFSKTYGWKQEKGFVGVEDLVHEASLTADEAAQGLREAISHDMVLELPMDPGTPGGRAMYLLNTVENRRFMDAYVTASQETPVPPEVLQATAPAPGTPPPAPPGPSAGSQRDPGMESGTIDAPLDLEPVYEDAPPPTEVPDSDEEVAAAPVGAPPSPPGGATRPDPTAPYEDWGYTYRTVEMIIRLLGRVPTKDEKIRLQDLRASDAVLIEAMGRLIEKKVDIYSSDLIVYEVEAMASARRREQRDTERKAGAQARQEKQKGCRSCDGLGYVFVGVSGIQECEACRG